jgi:hypothetical protein
VSSKCLDTHRGQTCSRLWARPPQNTHCFAMKGRLPCPRESEHGSAYRTTGRRRYVAMISRDATGTRDCGRRWSQSSRECPPMWSQSGRNPAPTQVSDPEIGSLTWGVVRAARDSNPRPPDPLSATTHPRPSSWSLRVSVGTGQPPLRRFDSGSCPRPSLLAWSQCGRSFGLQSPDRESGTARLFTQRTEAVAWRRPGRQ